jgi:2-methylfumaryl-CoA isomerase
MTYNLLSDLRVVEAASFIAAPTCGLHLMQMGAEVIRIDQIGGGPDFNRWPKAPNGLSLYWESLNKGKKSVALDLGRPEGRELAQRLAAAPGESGGLFVTNFPVSGFFGHDKLAALRPDLISLRVMGWEDGRPGLDYTVNAALGVPMVTGPASLGEAPVNHVLPAWDLLTGAYAAFALLAAVRRRDATGAGQEIRLPLADVAIMSLGHMGNIAEAVTTGADRPRLGNDVFGAFGRDFKVKDGRMMIVAISGRQWTGLLEALGVTDAVTALEAELGVSFARDEGVRFTWRDKLHPILERVLASRTEAELAPVFDRLGVCWGPYRTLTEALKDTQIAAGNPLLQTIEQPSGQTYPSAGPALNFAGLDRGSPGRAPTLGQHTDEVLAELLGMGSGEIGRLHDAKVVG